MGWQDLLVVLCLVAGADGLCYGDDIAAPVLVKEGDYMLAGIFDMSGTTTIEMAVEGQNYTQATMVCVDDAIYGLERALAFAWTLDEMASLPNGKTLGYKIYQACNSMYLTRHIAADIVKDDKIVGALVPGKKDFVEPAIQILSSAYIPTMTYIYSDESLLDQSMYPHVLSLSETEQQEAESTIRILREMGYTFIDIWYHDYSQEMAEYIFDNYVKKVGSGRCTRFHFVKQNETLAEEIFSSIYYNGTVREASVQLLLFNNFGTGKTFLKMVTDQSARAWQDKIYIFGYTNGRHQYVSAYTDILNDNLNGTESDDLLIFPQKEIINTKLVTLGSRFNRNETADGQTLYDRFLKYRENDACDPTIDSTCSVKTSSWTGFAVLAAKLFSSAVHSAAVALSASGIEGQRSLVYDSIVGAVDRAPIVIEDLRLEDTTFSKSTLISGYTVEVYKRSYGDHTERKVLGKVTFESSELDPVLLETLRPTQHQQHCSSTCHPGTYTKFLSLAKELEFPSCWTCDPCAAHSFTNITNQRTCTVCLDIEKSSPDKTRCMHVDVDVIRYKSGEFIGGASMAFVGAVLTLFVLCCIIKGEERPIIKASDPIFCYIFLFSLLIGNISSLMCIIVPSQTNCFIEYMIVTLYTSLITSSLFLRCAKIFTLFKAAESFSKPKGGMFFTPLGQMMTNLSVVTINVIIAVAVLHHEAWKFDTDQEEHHYSMYKACTSGNLKIAGAPFAATVVLFMSTLFLAFKMRKFPHNFCETSNIFMATLVVFFACVMFMSGYKFSPFQVRATIRSILMFITSFAFLTFMFVPKLLVLLKKGDEEEEKKRIKASLSNFTKKQTDKKLDKRASKGRH